MRTTVLGLLGLAQPLLFVATLLPQSGSGLSPAEESDIANEIKRLSVAVFEALDQGDPARAFERYAGDTTGVLNGAILPSWPEHVRGATAALRAGRETRHRDDRRSSC